MLSFKKMGYEEPEKNSFKIYGFSQIQKNSIFSRKKMEKCTESEFL